MGYRRRPGEDVKWIPLYGGQWASVTVDPLGRIYRARLYDGKRSRSRRMTMLQEWRADLRYEEMRRQLSVLNSSPQTTEVYRSFGGKGGGRISQLVPDATFHLPVEWFHEFSRLPIQPVTDGVVTMYFCPTCGEVGETLEELLTKPHTPSP